MNAPTQTSRSGFSLIETVIAIGVLAVLLTGFMVVFAPAAAGIRKSLNSQDAARLVATLEEELVTLRGTAEVTAYPTGFDKAFKFIKDSSGTSADGALLIYKYRASLTAALRSDGTPEPVEVAGNQIPGVDYVVQNMMRRKDDAAFLTDLPAIEGQVYMVRCTQLIADATNDQVILATKGQIANADKPTTAVATATTYKHAVITFVADFYPCPGKSKAYFNGAFTDLFVTESKPMFSRNLAARR
jgi:prepilin-type N-terminal cleavage/methylation domain-containing protein